jgi:hypothetical protein
VVLRDVRKTRAGGGERVDKLGGPKESEDVDLLARCARLAPRIGKPAPWGEVDPRFGEFSALPGRKTGNSPNALGVMVAAAPMAPLNVEPVRTGTIGLAVITSGWSRIEPFNVAEELLLSRLWLGDRANFSTRPPGLGKGR